MAKLSRGDHTRDEILKTAARLFSLHGYQQTSMADILQALSLSKGAFYYHFKSKQSLAAELLRHLKQDYRQILTAPPQSAPPDQQILIMLRRTISLQDSQLWDNPRLLARLAQETADQDGQIAQLVDETIVFLIETWQEFIENAQKSGIVSYSLDANATAQLIIYAILGAVACLELPENQPDIDRITQQIYLLILATPPEQPKPAE